MRYSRSVADEALEGDVSQTLCFEFHYCSEKTCSLPFLLTLPIFSSLLPIRFENFTFETTLAFTLTSNTFEMSDMFKPAPEPATELGRYRILSSTAGIRVSPLQLGAMSIGDAWQEFMGSMSKADSFKLLDAFVEAGGNFSKDF